MKALAVATLLVCLSFWGAQQSLALHAQWSSGTTAYNARRYSEAVRCFSEIVRAEPKNLAAVLYLANSYYALGQQKAAANYYQWILNSYPNAPEAATAKASLARLGASSGSSSSSGGGDEASQAVLQKFQSTAAVDPDSMVVVVKNLGDHPAAQPSVVNGIKATLKSAPSRLTSFLSSQGCKIYVTPTMIDKEPALLNTQPRGYEQGKTFKNVPACFDGQDVIVCNYAMRGSDDWEPTADPNGSLRHEMGHALDHYLGGITSEQNFKLMYYKDCGDLERKNPDVKERLSYYVQKAEGGPSECFAECVCVILGGRTRDNGHVSDINIAFPNVIKYIENRITKL